MRAGRAGRGEREAQTWRSHVAERKRDTRAKAARKLRQSETGGACGEDSRGGTRGGPSGAEVTQGDSEKKREVAGAGHSVRRRRRFAFARVELREV